MSFGSVFSSLRLMLAALLALALSAAPMAETAHASEPTEVCLTDHQSEAAPPADDQQGPAHDHTAHHCGSCHHHVWCSGEAEPFALTPATCRYRILPDAATLNAAPHELLRPPRA